MLLRNHYCAITRIAFTWQMEAYLERTSQSIKGYQNRLHSHVMVFGGYRLFSISWCLRETTTHPPIGMKRSESKKKRETQSIYDLIRKAASLLHLLIAPHLARRLAREHRCTGGWLAAHFSDAYFLCSVKWAPLPPPKKRRHPD
jgi:hypothetical protein